MTRTRISAVLLAIALTTSPALAQRYWVTNGDGVYSTPANWSDTSNGAGGFSKPTLTTHHATFDLIGAGAYTVTLTGNEASTGATVTNNLVTLDLDGFKYDIGEAASGGHNLLVNTTGAGTARLTLTGGTAALGEMPPGGGIQTLDFTRVQGASGSGGAKMVVDGANAVFWSGQTAIGLVGGSNTTDSRLEVINGGTFHSISDGSSNGGSILVSSNSLLTSYSMSVGGTSPAAIDINSGGTLRVKSQAGFGAGNFGLGFVGTATLDNGTIELNGSPGTGGRMTQHGLLRGNGTIKRAAGSTGLSEVRQDSYASNNKSVIRPGDVPGVLVPVGTLNLQDTNLSFMTASASDLQEIHLDIASPTSFDKIILTNPGGDVADVTASLVGSILFNNLNAINFTSDTTMDFITAEEIFDAGFTTNIASVAASWTYNGGTNFTYDLSIVELSPTDERLRLTVTFLPEPTGAIVLLGLALPLLARRRSKLNLHLIGATQMKTILVATFALLGMLISASATRASVIFQDNFEASPSTNIWLDTSSPNADSDPNAVSPGGSTWDIIESEPYNFQVQNQPANAFPGPGASPAWNTPFGQQYLHTYWSSATPNNDGNHAPFREAVVEFSGADQAEMAGATKLAVDVEQYNATLDGYSGSLSIIGWDAAPGDHNDVGSRAFHVTFKADNSVAYYKDGVEVPILLPTPMTFVHNLWQHVTINANFATDTFTVTVGSQTSIALPFDDAVSKITSLEFGTGTDPNLARGGWDNLVVTAVPEPASASLLVLGALSLLARKRSK